MTDKPHTLKDHERCLQDIKKLKKIMHEFVKMKMHIKYPQVYEWVRNYASDAEHFYMNGDYFTSFGCANYAYGFIDCILIIEGKKNDEITGE